MEIVALTKLPDGIWQVTTSYLCAGFVVKAGLIISCAPILRPKISYWMTVARRIECPVLE